MARTQQPLDGFIHSVEQALEHWNDDEWLGRHSPLAAPYFLGHLLDAYPSAETPASRGRALRLLLQEAAQPLTVEQQQVLEASFFQRNPQLNNAGVALRLGYSQATYYRHRTQAIEALAQVINQRLLPPLRPEMPRTRSMVGRASLLADCWQTLQGTHTVALIGPGGVGKTTLGLALREQWGKARTFWFTIRPGLTDQLSSLVFALGYFLRGLGAANTWRQLVADRGVLNLDRALGLLRYDLAMLKNAPPLLCIDEVEQLQQEQHEHAQIIHLLEELHTLAPLLILGQRLVIEPHQFYLLTGLTHDEIRTLLTQAGVPLSLAEEQQLRQVTRGNPALLTLFITLWRTGENATLILSRLGSAPSVELLLNRIWLRLDEATRTVLMTLAVFRTFAPQDAWPPAQAIIEHLLTYELLLSDGQGGLAVLPYVRPFVQQRTPSALATILHRSAAHIREARGEYTAAAYHYIAAQQPALAVWVWFNHRTQEVERGWAAAASALFKTVALSDLEHEEDRRALALLRAEVLKLTGAAQEAEAELHTVAWPLTHPITPYIRQLHGDILEMQDHKHTQILDEYRNGLHLLHKMMQQQEVELLIRRGYIYLSRLRDLEQARHEALLARLKAEDFYGNVAEEAGNYDLARTHYETALAIAESVRDNLEFLARIHSNLGRLTWRQGDATTALAHLEQSTTYFQERGSTVAVLHNRVNLSGAYIIAGRYTDALEQVWAALPIAESMRHGYLIAGLTANAGEACYYLNQWDEAEQYSLRSLQQEEEAHRPYALTVLGLVQHARGQMTEAEQSLQAAIASASAIEDKYAEAAAWRAAGQHFLDNQNQPRAQDAFRKAINCYRELGLEKEIAALQAIVDLSMLGTL